MRDHKQVLAGQGGLQVGASGAPSAAVVHRHAHPAEPLLLEAVVIRGRGVASLLRRLQPDGVQRVFQRAVSGVQRPGVAAVFVASLLQRLGPAEIGQHVLVAPARRALLFPPIEVLRVAAHIHHAVDRRRSAQHLAARRVQPAPAQVRLRLGLIGPVIFRHVHRDGQRARHLDQHRGVGPAILQQQDRGRAVLRQPVRQDAASRTRADNHVVIDFRHGRRPSMRRFGGAGCRVTASALHATIDRRWAIVMGRV